MLTIQDNIFLRQFHALELFKWFQETFIDSFPMEIYKMTNGKSLEEKVWDFRIQAAKRGDFSKVKFPTKYSFSHQPDFEVCSGLENTYVDLVIYDEACNGYVVHWGYKRGSVCEEYYVALVMLLIETYRHYKNK